MQSETHSGGVRERLPEAVRLPARRVSADEAGVNALDDLEGILDEVGCWPVLHFKRNADTTGSAGPVLGIRITKGATDGH